MIGELTNHLWQSTLFALTAGFLTMAFRKNRAKVRYWLWLSASLKFFVPFTLLMSLGSHLEWMPAAKKIATPGVVLTVEQIAQPFSDVLAFVPSSEGTRDWAPMAILGVWACGFMAIAFIRLRGWYRIRAAVRSSILLETPTTMEVRSSPGLLEPGVVGFLHPILLLPSGISERLTPAQLEAVLVHESCHIRRRDNLSAAIHMMVEALFWFHPLVWWIGAHIVEERERACDEHVLQLGYEPGVYAEAVLNVCKYYLESPLACVSGITGSDLKKRIEAILAQRIAQKLTLAKKVLLAVGGLAAVLVPIGMGLIHPALSRAQTSGGRPAFEVASIKPNASGEGLRFHTYPGGRFTATGVSLRMLITATYDFQDYQIFGVPKWINSERWDIVAKTENGSSTQMAERVKSLVEDRFKLKFHRETKEMPVYFLVIGKGGPKFSEDEEECPADPPSAPEPGKTPRSPCGRIFRGPNFIYGDKMHLMQLLLALSPTVGRSIIDKTGLTGKYDFKLTWTPESNLAQVAPGAAPQTPPESSGPSIFTALQEQLGLRLESEKGPVEVLMIDHVERPSEN